MVNKWIICYTLLFLLVLPICFAQDVKLSDVTIKGDVLTTDKGVELVKNDFAVKELTEISQARVELTKVSTGKLDENKDCIKIESEEYCFQTNQYSEFYYKVQDDDSIKFAWKIPSPTGKEFVITTNRDISNMNVDWSDFDKAGLQYNIKGNVLTITNPELTNWWFDPVINTTALSTATAQPSQRKVIQMPNGNIYTILNDNSIIYLAKLHEFDLLKIRLNGNHFFYFRKF